MSLESGVRVLLDVEEEEGVIAGITECLPTVEEDVEAFVQDPFQSEEMLLYTYILTTLGVYGTGEMDGDTIRPSKIFGRAAAAVSLSSPGAAER